MAPKKSSAAKASTEAGSSNTTKGGSTVPTTQSTAAPPLRRSARIAAAKAAAEAAETKPTTKGAATTKTRAPKKAATDAVPKAEKKTKGPSKPTKGGKKSGTNTEPAAPEGLRRGRSATRANLDTEPTHVQTEPITTKGHGESAKTSNPEPTKKRSASPTPVVSEPAPKRPALATATEEDEPNAPQEGGKDGTPEQVRKDTTPPPPSSSPGKRKSPSPGVPETPVKRVCVEPGAQTRSIWSRLKRKGLKTPSPRRIHTVVTAPVYSNPARNPCGHKVHPAYAGTGVYVDPKCPRCRMQVCFQDLRNVQDWIAFGGGIVAIRERCDAQGTRDSIYSPLVKGIGRGRRAGLMDPWNKDLSLRQSQVRLANLVLELEKLSMMELAWEKRQTAEARNSSAFRDVRTRRLYSATGALARHKAEREDGTLLPALQQEEVDVRKRSLDAQTAYGPSQEEINALVTRELENPPKRKRRCETARVSINPKVFVRLENDIDVLRKTDFSRPAVLPPPISVLRTAPPPKVVSPSLTPISTPTHPQPSQVPREVAWLRLPRKSGRFWYKRVSVKANYQSEFNRPGTTIVDTSGSSSGRAEFSDWYEHVNELQEEADRWDAADARDKANKQTPPGPEDEEGDTEPDSDTEGTESGYLGGLAGAPPQNPGTGRSLFDM